MTAAAASGRNAAIDRSVSIRRRRGATRAAAPRAARARVGPDHADRAAVSITAIVRRAASDPGEHDGDEVGQRAERTCAAKPDRERNHERVEALGDDGQSALVATMPIGEPGRCPRSVAAAARTRRRSRAAAGGARRGVRPGEHHLAGEVARHTDEDDGAKAGDRAGDGHATARRAAVGRARPLAPHPRRSGVRRIVGHSSDEGARDRYPDPAEHVGRHVGEQRARERGLVAGVLHRDAQAGAHRQRSRPLRRSTGPSAGTGPAAPCPICRPQRPGVPRARRRRRTGRRRG